jgi:signal transduction histidine kinase
VNRAIRELLVLYQGPLFRSRGLAVELDLAEGDPAVVGNARTLKQVLLNLLKNASEAMDLGGQVEIATADLVNVEGRMMVEITVADSGPGLSACAVSRLFELGAEGHRVAGRGLGLANSLRFVREMGGHLSCRSRPDEGATFAVLLPRVADARVARYRRKRQLGA